MNYFTAGSQAHEIFSLLSVVGEISFSSLHLLGNAQSVRNFVYDARKEHSIKKNDEIITCKLLKILGRGEEKRFRIAPSAIPILKWIGAQEYYLDNFYNAHFPSSKEHLRRNLRVSETVMMCMKSGMEFRPYRLPQLQDKEFLHNKQSEPIFYTSKAVKAINKSESLNKFRGSIMVGIIAKGDGLFTVYNCCDEADLWKGGCESRAKLRIEELMRMNYGMRIPSRALILGYSFDVARDLISDAIKYKGKSLRFNRVFSNTHFVPNNEFGIQLLQILTEPDSSEKILSEVFPDEYRAKENEQFVFDARVKDTYIFSFLDCDMSRLIQFYRGVEYHHVKAEVFCYPEQVKLIKEIFGPRVDIKTISIKEIHGLFRIKRRDLFEKL